jgi:hypothetical protein
LRRFGARFFVPGPAEGNAAGAIATLASGDDEPERVVDTRSIGS